MLGVYLIIAGLLLSYGSYVLQWKFNFDYSRGENKSAVVYFVTAALGAVGLAGIIFGILLDFGFFK